MDINKNQFQTDQKDDNNTVEISTKILNRLLTQQQFFMQQQQQLFELISNLDKKIENQLLTQQQFFMQQQQQFFELIAYLDNKLENKSECIVQKVTFRKEKKQKFAELNLKNQQLENENQQLRQEHERLHKEHKQLRQENEQLNNEKKRFINELHQLKRDKTATYLESSQTQLHLLIETFKHLKEEDFQNLSKEIFKLRKQYDIDFAKKYPRNYDKFEVAKIKALLAKKIFIGSNGLLNQQPESDSKTITQNVIKAVNNYLGKQGQISPPIQIGVSVLVEKGFKLLKDMIKAAPSGELIWIEKEENLDFDANRHKVIAGCEEKGKIELTVYPGYLIRDTDKDKERIFEKVLVLTQQFNCVC